jgi:hypothetical protein
MALPDRGPIPHEHKFTGPRLKEADDESEQQSRCAG